ncbi:PLP-dependent aminotransferase family protein [Lentzea sp. NPDC042327]|uniref:aminotransferase-like domain-containing protein n=1 Tax=Lentzea sp. NPDC042327 TaxID=3154801 RepID=UPI0033E3D6C1
MPFIDATALRRVTSGKSGDVISLASGTPDESDFDLNTVRSHLELFHRHLADSYGGDERDATRTILQYGRVKGVINDLVARHLEVDEQITADADSIVVTVGGQEALFLVMRAVRRTDRDAVLAVHPTYFGFTGAAELADLKVLPVKDSADGIDLDDLADVAAEAVAAGLRPRAVYVVPDFANPTGTTMPVHTRQRLLELAGRLGLLVVEDNAYGLLSTDRAHPRTIKSMDRDKQVVYCSSFAKTGVPGARVGYVVADQPVTGGAPGETLSDELARIKNMVTLNTSPIAQAVIGGKLLHHDFSLREANLAVARHYHRNLTVALDTLAELFPEGSEPEVTWSAPRGGFFIVVNVPFETTDELSGKCAAEHGVLWVPIHRFYGDGRPRRQLRISISSVTPEALRTGLVRLAGFISQHVENCSPSVFPTS